MEQPPGFEDPLHLNWLCEVNRLIYGLKQSQRQWNLELHKALIQLGLTNSKYNPTLYFKVVDSKLAGALTAHVDNLAVVGKLSFVDSIIAQLGNQIGADKDLHHFLSIKITQDIPNCYLFMNQEHYINDLCDFFLGGEHTSVTTPTDSNFKDL
jgi:hypothetical protein